MEIAEIIQTNDPQKILPLFQFQVTETDEVIVFKFNLWTRYFFPKYLKEQDAPFHKDIDTYNLSVYKGKLKSFTDIAFRGAAKSTRTKLFKAFCIANDLGHFRKYLKVLSKDLTNSKQIVTDIYNMFVDIRVKQFYPEVFAKTDAKREETMSSFTTATGVKLTADTVGTDQRGQVQEEARPDDIWFEDFETRKTLRSAVETKAIWDNMEEARTGLSINGGCTYTCNYISERGNVHKLVEKENSENKVLIIPIVDEKGEPVWNIYTKADIEQMRIDDEDFEGERMCKPSASSDVLFDREKLNSLQTFEPRRIVAGLKIFEEFNPSHRYGIGSDIGGGVGLDSSTAVIIDFDILPCKVIATFKNNTIKPDIFGDELNRIGEFYSFPILAPEKNNHGHATIGRLKQIYDHRNLFKTLGKEVKTSKPEATEYGWHTNGATKPKMFYALKKAVEDGLLILTDKDIIAEAKSYSRDDLMDLEDDPRLSTRHFDLLIATAIAWQLKDFATAAKENPQVLQTNHFATNMARRDLNSSK